MPKKSKHVILDNSLMLKEFSAPPTTNTYKAVPHIDIYNNIMEQAKNLGFEHMRDQIEVTHGGDRAFMNIQFHTADPTLPFSVAARSTYDRSASLGLATGASVFICANLMISGSDTTIMRRHRGTIQEDLTSLIATAFAAGEDNYKSKVAWRELLKETGVTERQGEYLLAMANVEGALNKLAHKQARDHWLSAPFAEFQEDRSLWGLYNAMTWGAHKVRPDAKLETHSAIVDFTETIKVENNKLVIA